MQKKIICNKQITLCVRGDNKTGNRKKSEPNTYRVFLGYFGTRRFRMSASMATIPSVTLFGRCIINSYRPEDKTQKEEEKKLKLVISYLE